MRSTSPIRFPEKASDSQVRWVTIPRSIMGVERRFAVVLPRSYGGASAGFPVLYLLRGAEDEWLGSQDRRQGLIAVLNQLIEGGEIDPLIVVLPGFMEPAQQSQGIPVDWSLDGRGRGVGNGRFERHFFEIKAIVEQRFQVRQGRRHTAVDGFSMGGFSALYLTTKHPNLFGSCGAYDGSFMWPDQIDPRRAPWGRACRLWFSKACSPFFQRGGVWDLNKMERSNPLFWIGAARGKRLKILRNTRFHFHAAGSEEAGNVDRNVALDDVMRRKGIANTFRGALRFEAAARHDWRWADMHLAETLLLHDRVFRLGLSS